jgi:hypothetical protein
MKFNLYAGLKNHVKIVGFLTTGDRLRAMFAAQSAAFAMYTKAGGFNPDEELDDLTFEAREHFDFENKYDYYIEEMKNV